ncbi:Calcium-binding protein [Actinidia chinensis var. chinensis]|uniref:Calcium-binding protein n=1 Tax=Actinidia chinensis var. chinensis TaxID=1590841 RepID=A0A2R6PXR7_ACTCC|nr:Calcium-binding protein [Actinidia chinensis var. chinensis]
MASKSGIVFEDFFPSMVQRLGAEGFMDELCNGFRLLMDEEKGVITFESLKKNSVSMLGLKDMSNDELMCMLREGDLDGDGCLNQMEFCVLMFRLSPELMKGSRRWIEEVVMNEL